MEANEPAVVTEEEEKLLSGNVPESVFWEFKRITANRKENMKTAILQAAMLYIHATDTDVSEVQQYVK
ncbi:MAG: hypothetical protein RR324_01195 [Cellulosilyticaceae bacterium]